MNELKHFINGEVVGSQSGKTFENINPATGELISLVHEGGEAQIDHAVASARAALSGPWGTMPMAERMELLQKLAAGIKARAEEFATECGVCYAYDLEGEIPDRVCDEPRCGRAFHHGCLYEWMRGLPSVRQSFGTLFGECPYCGTAMTIRAKTK